MDWSIQDVASMAGTTSRTLRHYDDIGLLKPTLVVATDTVATTRVRSYACKASCCSESSDSGGR